MTRSIRGRTLLLVLGVLAVSLSLISWRSYHDAQHEIEELFDAQLALGARQIAGLVGRELPPETRQALQQSLDTAAPRPGVEAQPDGHDYENKLGFVVLDRHGEAVLQSASLIMPTQALDKLSHGVREALANADEAARRAQEAQLIGYRDVLVEDQHWRIFVLHDVRDAHWVLVGEREDVRGELVGKIALRSMLPDLVGLPLVALLTWLAVGWGLRPLERLVQLLRARDPQNLSPLELAPLPRELEAVVASLNRLLGQVRALIAHERRFIADAAHELRTPLTVLRIHAQNALQASDTDDRAQALVQLEGGVERATRLVSQLLTLARLDPDAQDLAMTPVDLAVIVRSEIAELVPLTLARDQTLTVDAPDEEDFHLTADAPSLGVLLQNLVGNAINHTPMGGEIRIVLDAGADGLTLHVQDSGPGIAADLRARALERFYRHGAGQGAGLGLSIVARIVEHHGGSLQLLDSPLGGLEVRVSFPRAGLRA